MADSFVSVTYSDGEVRDSLQKLQRKLNDLTPAMKNIGQYMLLATDERFEKEVSPSGEAWQRNSPSTIARKRALGRIQKVLQQTGRLRDSINYQASRDRVVVGTIVGYAPKHQLGQGSPRREFLGVSTTDRREIVAILESFLTEN